MAIIVGITGRLAGQVVLSFNKATASRIAGQMTKKPVSRDITTHQRSALSELANMIAGHATIELSEAGFLCDITPPSLLVGTNIRVAVKEQIKTVVIPLKLSHGNIFVNLSLMESTPGAR